MDRRRKKMIASMLVIAMVLSNSNVPGFAGNVSGEEESVIVEPDQETDGRSGTQEGTADVAGTSDGEDTKGASETAGADASENPVENSQKAASADADAETSESTSENSGEESADDGTGILDDEIEEVNLTLELLEDEAGKAGENKREINTVDDLVALSKEKPESYQNAEIILAPHDTKEMDLSGTNFAGLGSDAYPFKGSISFSGNYTGYITLDKSLFNAVSGDAKMISVLNLKAANNMTDPILAKSYVKGETTEPETISLKIDAKSTEITEGGGQTSYSSFGGVIGTLGKGASVSLDITNAIPQGNAAVSGKESRGFFCNTMMSNASLTVNTFTGNTNFTVTSTSGNAGALVGTMETGAQLTVVPEFTFSGSVTGAANAGGLVGSTAAGAQITLQGNYTVSGSITSGNGNAGGLIGLAENNPVSITEGKSISVNAASLSAGANSAAGGLFGSCTVSGANAAELDFTTYTINDVSITSGKYAGGAFGILSNETSNGTIQIKSGTADESKEISSTGQGADNYGGLIGNYQANQLASGLELTGWNITSSHTGEAKTAYSGVIAEVTGKSYVKMENLTVSVDQQVANGSYFGGLVANCSGKDTSGFFDIGTVKVSSTTNNTVKADGGASGGLIGKLEDGVVRLFGTTDLSGIQPGGEGSRYGQLVGNRGAALVYAVGTGSNYEGTKGTGWTLVRDGSEKAVSDIGNWGEVIRVDGTKLKEGSSELLAYDSTNHTVTVKSFNLSNISNEQDFAALALTMQCSGAKTDGALRFSGSATLDSQIILTGDNNTIIDLRGTGVIGLMRDDGTQNAFTGKLDGGNHTLTLDIGDAYGVKADGGTECKESDTGCGQIYNHSYLGLFAKTGNLTEGISNLTISGSVNYGLSTQQENWVGGVTAFQEAGTVSYQNVTSDIAISFTGSVAADSKETLKAAHVGGFVGAASGAPKLTFTGCKWTGSITDSATTASYCYLGGYIGSMSPDDGSIMLIDSSIGNGADERATITVTQSGTVLKTGGILAAVETKEGTDNKITITADGFTVNGFDTSSAATESTGGFLGYDWHNVDFTVSGLSVANATLNAENAGFGGLVYEAGGHWIVKEPDESQSTEKYGIKYGKGVSFNGKSADATPSALLVCRGDDYRSTDTYNDNYALYLELDSKAAYQVDSTVEVTLNGGNYFDELVGISMGTYGNGVVSIATENHEKLNQSNCNTYQKQLSKDYDNPHTRYYYNLDRYNKAEGDIESGEELIMWTLGQDAEWNIKDYFRVEDKDTYTKVRTVTGKIDLTGLSYYPIDYVGKINIDNAEIVFDYAKINSYETDNKLLNNSNKQHYMMQTGLFRNLTSQKDYAAQITVTNSKLSGSIGQTADGVSGALVVGTMQGQVTENKLYPATVRIDGLTLDGIYVDGVEKDDYAPLLVNAADRNATLNIKNVTTSDAYQKNNRTSAATSLFGNIGNEKAINMSVSFQNMKLDARTDSGKSDAVLYNTKQSIFTKATFLHSFQYDPKDTASSGSYTFTKDDTVKQNGNSWSGNVTYGLEISNTESGRNQKQQYYYLGEISNPEFVQDAILNTTSEKSTDSTCFANGKYLRYVAVKEGNDNKEYYHEIDINLQSADILEGCGTYDDPFRITSGAQLETVAAFIATGISNGWKVNLPKNVVENQGSLSAHDTTEKGHYQYKSDSASWKAAEDSAGLNSDKVRAYMRNAYYQIENNIELSASFYGLGGSQPDQNTFSGVIIGKKGADNSCPTVYITAQGTTKTFGGLIAFSQGSVVKNLNLEFGGKTAANSQQTDAAGETADREQTDDGELSDGNNGTGKENDAIDSCAPMSITIESQKPSQKREEQSFFGGVIGYVVGGDNIIDNVTLNNLTEDKIKVIGDYGNIVDIGGYVGLIGGNLESGGGVIFRNINGSGLDEYKNANSEFYYRNPFVGRVLDGYACSEGCKLENTDKNYKIPELSKENKLSITAGSSKTPGKITISSAQQLWVLSAIVNSGAGGGAGADKAIKYNNDAYNYGRSRTGTYDNVGTSVSSNGGEAKDNTHWGGELTEQVSYLVSNYASSNEAAKISSALSAAHSVEFKADCDMTAYGNGFRGIGTTYQDNQPADVKYDSGANKEKLKTGIRNRTLWITGTVGGENSTNPKITLARNVKEYASEGNGGWWAQGIGLFPVVNFSAAATVQNLTISGTSCISYQDDRTDKVHDYIGEASAGGFAGMTANGSGVNDVTFKNVKAANLTVTGSKYSGGFFGVIGQSSRTTSTKLVEVSSTVGTYTFKGCSYSGITVEGGYSAGGFVGTYKNDGKAMKVSGQASLSASNIGWVKDACLEMYTVNNNKDDAKMNGYSGGGGIVGYYYGGNMNVATEENDRIILDGLYIYGPQFAYNCDYGLGGIVGLYANKTSLAIKNIYIKDTAVEVQIDPKYVGKHTKNPSYYTTPACGLLLGYSANHKTNTIKIEKAEIKNSYVLNAGIGGGLLGRPGLKTSISDTTIDGLTVYSQGAASYTGSTRAGGILGSNGSGDVDIKNLTMNNVTVVSDGNTALLQGLIYSGTKQTVNHLKTENCVVVTTQKPEVSDRYFNEKFTDPGSENADIRADKFAGTAGLFLGASKLNVNGLNSSDTLYGFNIGVKDLTLGYYCGSTSLTYSYDNTSHSGQFSSALDSTTIGAYDANGSTSYANMKMSDANRYTGGYLGLITGANNDSATSTVKIIGMSVQGGNYPYELNGNNDETFVRKSVDKNGGVTCNGTGNNYVIFSDYTGNSFTETRNTEGTIGGIDSNSNYQVNTPAPDPYVIINAASALKVYSSEDDTTGMKLTSDGMNDNAKKTIVSDLTQGTGSKIYQQKYQRVRYAKENDSKKWELANVAEKFDSTSSEYKERLSTYFTASESKTADYTGISDFDVLVIDTSKSSEITQMIHEYLSVLTNCDQTGIGSTTGTPPADKAQYTSMNAYTYKWNVTKFVKTENTLIINEADHSVSVRAGAHDNQNNQFTVLDVYYANPSNAKEGYHLFIPIVVKKILQTEFSIKMRNGSSAYSDAYTSNAAMLANYGEDFTAQLTYSYIWTADEWNANIAAGTNFLWSYDKQVKLGEEKEFLAKKTTRYTLVDMNRREAGVTFFTGTGTNLTGTEGKQDAVLKFNDLKESSDKSYSSVYLSDLLPLKAKFDLDGTLKKLSSAKGATIRIWNIAKSEYEYYGPKDSNDSAGTPYYTVTVGKTGSEEVKVSEVYYLTVNCQEDRGVITQNATLGLDRMTSADPLALPSRKRSAAENSMEQNTYTLGKFYNVTDVRITPEGKDKTGSIKSETNDYINLDLSAKVAVPEAYEEQFNTYAKGDSVYFRFAIRMQNKSQDDTGSDQILTNTVQALFVKLGNTELPAEDYTCEVSDGVLYLLVKNKKGNDFSNITVTAKLRLSYSGGEIDAQFPMRKGQDTTSGITFSSNASIAYSENSLDGSTMSGTSSNSMKFYRETISAVSITYRAYENVSQLGINGKEVTDKGGVTITTQGIYNAMDVAGLNTTDEKNESYPYYLIGSLQLQKKDNSGKYTDVTMSDYIKSVSTNKGNTQDPGQKYEFEIPLTPAQVQSLATEPIKIDFSYFVKSDKALEELGAQAQYANYKVILTAHLANKAGTALVEDVSDYLIYTNAKFYDGIISTRDFDQQENR